MSSDRDVETLRRYQKEGEYRNDSRLTLIHARFSEFAENYEGEKFDSILLDLGVSTRQLLEGKRGFSLQEEGPLDMRMDPSQGETLSEYLARVEHEELANALFHNADLRNSRALARRILFLRDKGELKTTQDLAKVAGPKRGPTHPATPIFMALRMAVNKELEEIRNSIPLLIDHLRDGGRLAVITFHSTEDRLVKQLFKSLSGQCICEKHPCICPQKQRVTLLTRKPIEPTEQEIQSNPRSRSAKLRVVERIN